MYGKHRDIGITSVLWEDRKRARNKRNKQDIREQITIKISCSIERHLQMYKETISVSLRK